MKITARGSFNPDDGGGLGSYLQAETARVLRSTTRRVLATAKLRSPVDTGQLRNSHRVEPITVQGLRARTAIVADKTYAAAVHDGTRPHIIRPRRAKVLAFQAGGRTVYTAMVRHPGSQPRPWLYNAAKAVAAPEGFTVTPGD